MRKRGLVRLAILAVVLALPLPAAAHLERPATVPSNQGSVPDYRTSGPYLVVCKRDSAALIAQLPRALKLLNLRLYDECRRDGFEHLQAAVDAVSTRGTRILVLPGVYHEQPSLRPLEPVCAALERQQVLSYQEQAACPHAHNVVAIIGDGPDDDKVCDGRLCELQVEGTGASPNDVVFDGGFKKFNVIRAERADGVFFRNFTVQGSQFTGLYVIETDGFAVDRMVARWNDEYGFLTFAVDNGLYKDCEAFGNGEAGLYPGSQADLHGTRRSTEVVGCRSYHNAVGLSGTAGDSMYVHDNEFFDNSMGVVVDSLSPGHPGLPQNSTTFVNNNIHSNNQDFERYWRDGTCERPSSERGYEVGVVCPTYGTVVGTGIVIAGGNGNVVRENRIWNNWRFGTMQFWVPASIRGEDDPAKQFDTSHANRYELNRLGTSPSGQRLPNGVDFWWDEEGAANCWNGNLANPSVVSDPTVLPDCSAGPPAFTPPNFSKTQRLLGCLGWFRYRDATGCEFAQAPSPPQQ